MRKLIEKIRKARARRRLKKGIVAYWRLDK